MRTDDNNNPTAFTTSVATMGLTLNADYVFGTPFPSGSLITAKILGDPITTTIKLIDIIGFFTLGGKQRWWYIGIPHFVWLDMSTTQKRDVIGEMYRHEGGVTMRGLFPNYGKLAY